MSVLTPRAIRRVVRMVLLTLLLSFAAVLGPATPVLAVTMWTVQGHITSGGSAVGGVAVAVYPPGSASGSVATTTSDAQGSYSMSVPEGTWDIVFTPASPFLPVTKSNFSVISDRTLDVVLVQEGVSTLSGRIVDHTGTPIIGVSTNVYNPSLGQFIATTGPDGRFSIYARNGSYRLAVHTNSTVNGDVPPDNWQFWTADQAFTLAGNTDVGDLVLPAPSRLNVTVLDPANQPVSNARVRLANGNTDVIPGFGTLLGLPIAGGNTNSNLDQSTGSNGTITGTSYWPTNKPTLRIDPPTTQPNLLPVTTAPVDLSHNAAVTVNLPTGTTLSGRIVDHTGTPIIGVSTNVYNPSLGQFIATTGPDGRFSIYARNGSYRLAVHTNSTVNGDVPPDNWQFWTADQAFTLAGNTDVGDLVLPAPSRLNVTVLDPANQPVSNARVRLANGNTDVIPGFGTLLGLPIAGGNTNSNLDQSTGSNGTITGTSYWPTNKPTLRIDPPTTQPNLLPVTTAPVDLSHNAAVTVNLPTGTTLSGRIVDHTGTPIIGVSTNVYNPSLGQFIATTGPDGRFSIYARNGSYRLAVHTNSTVNGDVPPDNWQFWTADQAFTLAGNTDVGDLVLPAPSRLNVTVLDPANQPVSNARVRLANGNTDVIPGFGTLLGLPIAGGNTNSNLDQSTGSNGTITGTSYWPTNKPTLRIDPPTTQPNLLPVTTPAIGLATSVDLVVAYQANGSVSLISGAADRYLTQAATALSVPAPGVLGNDVNYSGGSLQAVLAQPPSHGTLQLNSDGSLQYQPETGYVGNDTFTYRATSGGLQSSPILVTISVADQTPPIVTGHADRDPAPYIWFNALVLVTWTSVDPAPSSGLPTTPGPVNVSTDGASQIITSAPSCDPAGNCATGQYVVSIDQIDPNIAYTVTPAANDEGWHNSDVTVTFTCADALSGIASCPAPVTVTADGAGQAVTGTATDNAGNTATATATVNLDKTKPQIDYTLSAPANGNGWHNTDVTVTFTCSDTTSGIASCPEPVSVDTETSGLSVTGAAFDRAGNRATTSVVVKLDKTAPHLDYTVSPAANSEGWNGTTTTVSFVCTDDLSGVAGIGGCPEPVTLADDGIHQVTGIATDNAGNTSPSIAVVVKVDKTAPVLGSLSWSANPVVEGATTTLTVSATDVLSGVDAGEYFLGADPGVGNGTPMTLASGNLTATVGTGLALGTYAVSVRGHDRAGNWSTVRSGQLIVQSAVQLTSLAPAKVWVGLKNSDDVGAKFDLLAEVYRDDTLVATGHLDNAPGGSTGFNNAKLNTIVFDSFAPIDFPAGSQLNIKLYVRNACVGPTHNSGTARLWYADSAADSRFGATIGATSADYYLLNNFALGTTPGSGPKKSIDVAAGAPCSPFKPFGTWTVTPS